LPLAPSKTNPINIYGDLYEFQDDYDAPVFISIQSSILKNKFYRPYHLSSGEVIAESH